MGLRLGPRRSQVLQVPRPADHEEAIARHLLEPDLRWILPPHRATRDALRLLRERGSGNGPTRVTCAPLPGKMATSSCVHTSRTLPSPPITRSRSGFQMISRRTSGDHRSGGADGERSPEPGGEDPEASSGAAKDRLPRGSLLAAGSRRLAGELASVHVLLDTCALLWLWLVGDPARLSARARAALESTETEAYVSALRVRDLGQTQEGEARAPAASARVVGSGVRGILSPGATDHTADRGVGTGSCRSAR
jgi:hypothetical protein